MNREDHTVLAISLKLCSFDTDRKKLSASSSHFGGRFPSRFYVRSHFTDALVEFIPVTEDDPLFDQDQWDGEQMVYRPTTKTKNVDYFVMYNEF
jgi:hypothetical protein